MALLLARETRSRNGPCDILRFVSFRRIYGIIIETEKIVKGRLEAVHIEWDAFHIFGVSREPP